MVGYQVDKSIKDEKKHYMAAGAVAGFFSRFSTQPFDVVKILMQLQVEPISKKSYESKYKGVWQCTKSIFAEEGIWGLWKGHIPGQYVSIIYGCIQITCFEKFTQMTVKNLHMKSNEHRFAVNFACGSLAGSVAIFFSHPFDVVRTRFVAQTEPKVLPSFRRAFPIIWKKEGFAGFYRGLIPTQIQIMPYSGFLFAFNRITNDMWRNYFNHSNEHGGLSTVGDDYSSNLKSFLCGGVAGTLAKTVVYPLDLLKKRFQMQGFQHARKGVGKNVFYSNMFDAVKQIVINESFIGLFKGLSPSLLKAFASSAVYFASYENSIKIFAKLF